MMRQQLKLAHANFLPHFSRFIYYYHRIIHRHKLQNNKNRLLSLTQKIVLENQSYWRVTEFWEEAYLQP